jgi:CBS domain containing-hemolysin-like protein
LFSDENSWLIDGGTPIEDVMRVLDIDEFRSPATTRPSAAL